MRNKFLDNVLTSVKIIVLFLLIVTICVAKSIYLILSVIVLEIIIMLILSKSVKEYILFIKKNIFWLLIFLVTYILFFRDILGLITLTYKMILIIILVKLFINMISFESLNSAIYTFITPLKLFKIDVEDCSLNISLSIYFIICFYQSSDYIAKIKRISNKNKSFIKYSLISRILFAQDSVDNKKINLNLKFYSVRKENLNIKSLLLLLIFIAIFIMTIYKEVIL